MSQELSNEFIDAHCGKIIAATGHRPDKLGGYNFDTEPRIWIRDQFRKLFLKLSPEYCVSGMALGVDQDFAYVCVELGIPFLAAVPFNGQECKWPPDSQKFYRDLISKAFQIHTVSEGQYSPAKMQKRNEWMVDNCGLLFAVWDGTRGGTANCLRYAEKAPSLSVGNSIIRVNPKERYVRNYLR